MPRRRRSFFFDNINKRLLVNTFKNARTSKAEIDAGTVTADDILKKSQIDSDVDASLANLVNTAPATLDTLDELAAALGDDANFATTTATSLGNRLRIDTNAQGLTSAQQTNAVTNLGLATVATSGAYSDLTGTPTIPTNNNQLTNGAGYLTSETFAVRGTMSNADASQSSGVYRINTGVTSQPGGSVTDYGTVVHFNNISDTGFQIACDYNSASFYFRGGNSSTFGGSGTNQAWSKVWCDNNDGSGSGLDADTCDGQHLATSNTPTFQGIARNAHHTGHLVGSYNSVGANSYKSNPIYTIGSSYNPSDAALGNMYGIGYTHTNASFIGLGAAGSWGMYVAADGDARIWLGGSTGQINASSNITAYASDGRLKTNVAPIENAIDKVKKIRGVTFDWVDNITSEYDFHPSSMHETGVIAQEIQEVIPDAVVTAPFNGNYARKSGVDHNFLTVDKDKIIPLLIEAIKEQQQQIEELKEMIGGSSD